MITNELLHVYVGISILAVHMRVGLLCLRWGLQEAHSVMVRPCDHQSDSKWIHPPALPWEGAVPCLGVEHEHTQMDAP
jgi:hypothetical protein